MNEDLHVALAAPGPEREDLVPLLLLADEPEPLHGYLQTGDLYVLRTDDGETLGATHILTCNEEPGTVQLKAVAIDQTRHNQGLGRHMLAMVLDDLRRAARGASSSAPATPASGRSPFIRRRDLVSGASSAITSPPEKGYDPDERENGLPHRDMVWFDQSSTESEVGKSGVGAASHPVTLSPKIHHP